MAFTVFYWMWLDVKVAALVSTPKSLLEIEIQALCSTLGASVTIIVRGVNVAKPAFQENYVDNKEYYSTTQRVLFESLGSLSTSRTSPA